MDDKDEGGDLVLQSQRKDIHLLCLPYYDQTPQLLFFSLFALVRLLFEGGIYFVRDPADSNS